MNGQAYSAPTPRISEDGPVIPRDIALLKNIGDSKEHNLVKTYTAYLKHVRHRPRSSIESLTYLYCSGQSTTPTSFWDGDISVHYQSSVQMTLFSLIYFDKRSDKPFSWTG
jgi:hypothetical protein